jgi:hypothetical protein
VLEKYDRPLTATERARLAELLDPQWPTRGNMLRWLCLWLAILVIGISILAGIAVWFDGRPGWRVVLAGLLAGVTFSVCVVACYGAYLLVTGYRHGVREATHFAQETAPRIRDALQEGRASVCRVTSEGVIVIEEFLEEDLGSAYIFDLGDGTSYYLRGVEYDFDEESDIFLLPSRFALVRTATNHIWLGVFNREGRLEPELTVSMKEMPHEYVWGDSLASESVLPGRPREILARLGYQGGELN